MEILLVLMVMQIQHRAKIVVSKKVKAAMQRHRLPVQQHPQPAIRNQQALAVFNNPLHDQVDCYSTTTLKTTKIVTEILLMFHHHHYHLARH